ncbi:hypothetical protein [Mesorhizobium sp. STM 4661]|uniref:DUF6894 family protein n=1 Tax=Mesorhizobium sp. STM 4661 TaxID=1297570 RepID=UPI0002BDC6F8|nr:hypothetical protein [Mesorhizobium sp. STM 4661]CCV15411.1 conserved hypothetical protein [Mesorhizobium sp. STM 4661]
MARYFFDIHDGNEFTGDEDGEICGSLSDVSDYAVSVLPDIAREELPNGPNRLFWIKVRDEDGAYIFRASLALASAWLVENANGHPHPGENLKLAALRRTRDQVKAIRRDLAEDGLSAEMHEIDALIGIAQTEAERMIKSLLAADATLPRSG